ncbi:MAG: HAMP domain-containing protein, partial [Elusimicrobia bacterium]|nr:HAMP domain-containing protein [Elusimicrobiota bacterium]
MLLVGRIVVNINDESLQFEVQRYHLHLAQSLSEKFDDRLASTLSQISLGVEALKNPSATWPDRQKALGTLIDASANLGIISAVTETGQEMIKAYNPAVAPEVDKNPSLITHAGDPLFATFLKTGKEAVRVGKSPEGMAFAEAFIPFSGAGRNAVYVKFSIDDLCQMVAREQIGKTGFAYYVAPDGKIVSRSPVMVGGGAEIGKDQTMVKTALAGNRGAREFKDSSGVAWVSASAPVTRLGGAIVTQQTRAEAYSASWRGKRQAAFIVFLTALFAVFAAYAITRSLVRPLLSISRVAREVDLGAGHFPEPVRISSHDELQELAETFGSMMQKLKGYADLQVEKIIIEQKKTEAIIFSIQDGIVMTDFQGKIQLANQRAREILHVPLDANLSGMPAWKYLPSAEMKTAFVDLLTRQPERRTVEVRLPGTSEGAADRYYLLSSEEVRTPGKTEFLGIVTVLHDITLEKQLEAMKEEFLHSITHDLRNPLTAIRGFIRLFQSGQTGQLSPIQTKMFETMDKASLRLMTMVNDILDLARLESNRLTLQVQESQLDDIAARVIELFIPQTRSSGIKLNLETVGKARPAEVDPNLIERVFTNLIGNATKFTPDGGSITVRIEHFDDYVRCSVIDTGQGIPQSYLEKVFDKFRQVEGNYKGGAGLGLTICKRIVEA